MLKNKVKDPHNMLKYKITGKQHTKRIHPNIISNIPTACLGGSEVISVFLNSRLTSILFTANLYPQCGQLSVVSEICLLHSGQVIKAIIILL